MISGTVGSTPSLSDLTDMICRHTFTTRLLFTVVPAETYVGEKTLDALHTALVQDIMSLYEDGMSVLALHASILRFRVSAHRFVKLGVGRFVGEVCSNIVGFMVRLSEFFFDSRCKWARSPTDSASFRSA